MSTDALPHEAPPEEEVKSPPGTTGPGEHHSHSLIPEPPQPEDNEEPERKESLEPARKPSAKLSTKDTLHKDSKEGKDGKERKESKQVGSRRVSMFEEPIALTGKTQSPEPGVSGDLKETLRDYFSNQPKDTPEPTTTLKPVRRPKIVFENTYRLESHKPFSPSRVQTQIQDILDEMLMDFKYNSKTSATKATEVAEKIRRNVLNFRFDRYKICVLVTISPLNRQGFFSGFRCLWDANRDSYAVATLRNPSMFAIAVCYGIYFE